MIKMNTLLMNLLKISLAFFSGFGIIYMTLNIKNTEENEVLPDQERALTSRSATRPTKQNSHSYNPLVVQPASLTERMRKYPTFKTQEQFKQELRTLFQLLEKDKNNERTEQALELLIYQWAKVNPSEAYMTLMEEFQGNLQIFELSYKQKFIEAIFSLWANAKPEEAVSFYNEHKNELNNRKTILSELSINFAKKNPQECFQWIQTLSDLERKTSLPSFYQGINPELLKNTNDFYLDLEWSKDNFDQLYAMSLANVLMDRSPTLLELYMADSTRYLSSVMKPYFDANYILNGKVEDFFQDPKTENSNIFEISQILTSNLKDFNIAKQWINAIYEHRSSNTKDLIVLIQNLPYIFPKETQQWIESLPDGDLKKQLEEASKQ